MLYHFGPEHTYAAYARASGAFVATYGYTPRDATRDPASVASFTAYHGRDAADHADFLDAWDVWLFSEEAEAFFGPDPIFG